MHEPLWVIYALRLKSDDEYRYVGLTRKGVSHRLARHLAEARLSTDKTFWVYRWIRKHGIHSITADVIDCVDVNDEIMLNFKEQFWIATFNQQFDAGLKKKKLLNMTEGGGSTACMMTEEARRKSGAASSIRNSGSGNPMFGTGSWIYMSEETKKLAKQKISKKNVRI